MPTSALECRAPPQLPPCVQGPQQNNNPSPTPLPATTQGAAIERFAQMTDWGYYEAARRFQRVLVAAGIDGALRARGVLVREERWRSRMLPAA